MNILFEGKFVEVSDFITLSPLNLLCRFMSLLYRACP